MDDEVRRSMARIGEATDRLLASAGALTDTGVREPSLLPGWTRGHVLTHIARNADGLGNLLRWARTGITTPMYASREARRRHPSRTAERSVGRTLHSPRKPHAPSRQAWAAPCGWSTRAKTR